MKKSNQITVSVFVLLLLLICGGVAACRLRPSAEPEQQDIGTTAPTAATSETDAQMPAETSATAVVSDKAAAQTLLFIGDSRTVGLAEYGAQPNADYFANVGMSVYNVLQKTVSVPDVGKVTLEQLLTHKKYDKILIMLGVNEIGYAQNKTVAQYRDLLSLLHQKQPNAILYIQANLHVTAARSAQDSVINNTAIDTLNQSLAALANGTDIVYLDVNPIFDDADGGLSAEKTGDSVHPYAKEYRVWSAWIAEQVVKP